MSWLKIDDGFLQHPKIMALTDSELRVWMRILCFSAANRRHREGQIHPSDRREIPGLTQTKIGRYIDLNLLEETDAPGTLKVHDFHTYNPTDKTATERKRRQRHAETNRDTARDEARDNPSDNDRENTRALRARARSRTRTPELTTAAASTTQGAPDNAAAAIQRLEHLELDGLATQIDDGHLDADFANAWLDLADQEATTNPAGFVLAGIRSGQPPSRRIDPGENGKPRRSPLERALQIVPVTLWDYDPVALGHELDELGVTDPGERRLVGAAVEAERSARGVQVDERASA
jgi:hypothetical protein